jgi:hypothetical protein
MQEEFWKRISQPKETVTNRKELMTGISSNANQRLAKKLKWNVFCIVQRYGLRDRWMRT